MESQKVYDLACFREELVNNDIEIQLLYFDEANKIAARVIIEKEYEERMLYFENLYIHESYRNMGISHQILDRVDEIIKNENNIFETIQLWVDCADNQFIKDEDIKRKNNKYLVELYTKHGFKVANINFEQCITPTMEKKINN